MSIKYPLVSWGNHTNIYEVNIRQYTPEGTFSSFSKHLPRLKNMGIEILWLMPITPISRLERLGSLGSYYACSSYTKINPEFGTITDFIALVEKAHQLGMKVIIDWVANHTGKDHEWTKHKDWYILDEAGNFTERNGWQDVIDLNFKNATLRKAMIEAMQFWIQTAHIDGFRCDMAHLVPLDFWQEAREACEKIKPLFWLGECDEDAYSQVFDTTYAWRWMHATTAAKNLDNIIAIQQHYFSLPKGAYKSFFTSNHDENSWNGSEYEKYGRKALSYTTLALLLPRNIPIIYSGQEDANKKRLRFFDKDVIEWQSPPRLENFFQLLLSVRKDFCLNESTYTIQYTETGICIKYTCKNKHLVVLCNLSDGELFKCSIQLPRPNTYRSLFSGVEFLFSTEEQFELAAGEYLIYIEQ